MSKRSPSRTILLAPDSFKGSLSALEVCNAMRQGIASVLPDARCIVCPVSDGGEGLVDSLLGAGGWTRAVYGVSGPLPGLRADASVAVSTDGRRVVLESAQAAGLMLVPPERRDPSVTTTRGVGELLLRALDLGAEEIVVGLGGSATNDGGAGMADAIGIRLLDRAGDPIPPGGRGLLKLNSIDLGGRDPRILRTTIAGAADVRNPLTGPEGAARVFAPQKGAGPEAVELLEEGLLVFCEVVRRDIGIDLSAIAGTGAAGGLAGGLIAFCGATLRSGIEFYLDAVRFGDLVRSADLVVTGEGRLDVQTRYGKAVSGVLRAARDGGRPVVIIAGEVVEASGWEGVAEVVSLVGASTSREEALRDPSGLIRFHSADVVRRMFPE